MNHDTEPEADAIAAGDFSTWLIALDEAIGQRGGSEVPCGGCTACCTSSQFVHIAPDETDTLAHIPAELLFPAPGLPRGHVLLGYDDRGHCPMFVDNRCSIYAHRPQTCRTYDCRIFSAVRRDPDQPAIAERTRRWRFGYQTADDRVRHDALEAAQRFLEAAGLPDHPTHRAVLAVGVHHLFLRHDEQTGRLSVVEPDPEAVLAEVARRRSRIG